MEASATQRRNALDSEYPIWPRLTIPQHFRVQSEKYPQRELLISPDKTLTYKEFWSRVEEISKALIALGVRRRDHVAVLMANEPEYVCVKMAIAAVGAVAIPLNTMLREEELSYMLGQSKSKWMFVHQNAAGIDHEKAIAKLLYDSQTSSTPITLEQVVVVAPEENPVLPGFLSYSDFLRDGHQIEHQMFETRFGLSLYPDEVCDIIYTSGTTGLPKGVMLTHDMLLRCGFSSALSRAFENGRRVFTPLPLYHVFAYVEGLLGSSFVGGSLIMVPSFRPAQSLSMISDHNANDMLCVPSMLLAMVNELDRSQYSLDSLYAVMCAAAPAPVPLWQQAVEKLGLREICTGYGGTEVSAATVHTEVGDSIELITTKVGRLKPGGSSGLKEFGGHNVQYKVVDPNTGEGLPEHEIGELAVRGNFVTHGYFDKPIETAEVIDKDGWFRTGDLGRIDENGYLEFLGRSKELFKVSGENVSPKEIEEVISKMQQINQVYVVGVPFQPTQEIGAAFIELKDGESLSKRQVAEWCGSHLAKFKVPRYVWFVERDYWPMTGTGKIQKFELRRLAVERITGQRLEGR